jgi:hypothetical protein
MASVVRPEFNDFLTNELFAECFTEIYMHFSLGKVGPRLVNTRLLDPQDFVSMLTASSAGAEEAHLENGKLAALLPCKGQDAMKIFYYDVLLAYDAKNPGNRDVEVIVKSIEKKARCRMEAEFVRRTSLRPPERGISTASIDSGSFSHNTSSSSIRYGRPSRTEDRLAYLIQQLEKVILETKLHETGETTKPVNSHRRGSV